MIIVLDAHILMWLFTGDKRLSPVAREMLDDPANEFVLPLIALFEIEHAFQRGRFPLPAIQVETEFSSQRNCSVGEITKAHLHALPPGLELHDGICVASAFVLAQQRTGERVVILSADPQVQAAYPDVIG